MMSSTKIEKNSMKMGILPFVSVKKWGQCLTPQLGGNFFTKERINGNGQIEGTLIGCSKGRKKPVVTDVGKFFGLECETRP